MVPFYRFETDAVYRFLLVVDSPMPQTSGPRFAAARVVLGDKSLISSDAATQCRSRDADQFEISANCFGLITVISGVISGNYALT